MKVRGLLVDIHKRDIYPAIISVRNGIIDEIERSANAPDIYLLPGLIDAHIHIESSMVTPGAFAMAALKHGTTGVVSDPHEIANVLGLNGVLFMIDDAKKVPLKFYFGAPSCVPATAFESSGASLNNSEVKILLEMDDIKFLSEMMNFPGVINNDPLVYEKIKSAHILKKPIDGHAPGLSGNLLKKYVHAGISTDHECSSMNEALEKLSLGMKILIREGSAAKNLYSLKELYNIYPDMLMLCSDDLHPEMLKAGHINKLISSLISDGYDIFDVLRSATIIPSEHYNLNAGLLRRGDKADFIIVDSLKKMNVSETWIEGKKVYGNGRLYFKYLPGKAVNKFKCSLIKEKDIKVSNKGGFIRVIEAYDGLLETKELIISAQENPMIESDIEKDILKIVVKDRYNDTPPVTGFIKGFGLRRGAFASSVAHDSHNIIAVGSNDRDIVSAINKVVLMKGGLAVSDDGKTDSFHLNIGGIMTTQSCSIVAKKYENLNNLVIAKGSKMKAPYMTLSFMALLVIPELKIGDKGLFDVKKFQPVSLFAQ